MLTIHFIFFSHCTSAFVLFPFFFVFFFVLFFTVFQCARVRVHVDGPHFKLNRGQGPTERERREKWVGVVVKVDGFRREKQDGWAEGRKERVKDREGIFSPPPSLLPAFLFSSCEGQAWRAAVWPNDCVRRLAVPHTGTPLITGAGLSLLDTKTPHTDSTAYTCTCKHTNTMNTCISYEHVRERGKKSRRVYGDS